MMALSEVEERRRLRTYTAAKVAWPRRMDPQGCRVVKGWDVKAEAEGVV